MTKKIKNELSPIQRQELLVILKLRFEKNMNRHKGISWAEVETRLTKKGSNPEILWSLNEMEMTGGEPDVVSISGVEKSKKSSALIFMDCSAESPVGRRSLCYDRHGWESRKEHRPENTAIDLAEEMGISLLNEAEYRALQTLGKFDTKTSSWLQTPAPIRNLGGSIFGDFRYGQVFIYHNGAQSYYGSRGFRGMLQV